MNRPKKLELKEVIVMTGDSLALTFLLNPPNNFLLYRAQTTTTAALCFLALEVTLPQYRRL